MLIDEYVKEKIELEIKKAEAFKKLWESELKAQLEKDLCSKISDDQSYDQWENDYEENCNAFGRYIFDGEKFIST